MNTGGWCPRPTYTTYLAILKENNTENLSNNHRKPLQKLLSDRIPIIKLSWKEKAIKKHPFSVTQISGIRVSFSHLWHQTSPFLHLAEINSFHMVINIHCKWMKHSLQDKTNMTNKLWYVTVSLVYLDTQNKMTILWKHSHSNDIQIYSFSEHVSLVQPRGQCTSFKNFPARDSQVLSWQLGEWGTRHSLSKLLHSFS